VQIDVHLVKLQMLSQIVMIMMFICATIMDGVVGVTLQSSC